jgi:hypothetical protein
MITETMGRPGPRRLPSALRELGILRDADEYTLGAMRRAGFHAALAVAAMLALGHGLALVVRRWPRAGGGLLVVACVALVAVMAGAGLDNPRARWGVIAAMVQAALVYGVTGVALLRETSIKEADL